MSLVEAVLAQSETLPPIRALGYEFVVAANGLLIRAEDSRLEALVPVAFADLHGLAPVEPYLKLKVPRLSDRWLWSVLGSARRHLPREVLFQFDFASRGDPARDAVEGWTCTIPTQETTAVGVRFDDRASSVLDLHSHGALGAFFSSVDDDDEQGFRLYAVIGRVDTPNPELTLRVGAYGHFMELPVDAAFDGPGPFCTPQPGEGESEEEFRADEERLYVEANVTEDVTIERL